ncbi:hypothetical protein ACFYVR_00435 [Rhodococcus sp. NPDC003318]|uniref:hypothetical protein n=1 Tax=Rhodococcus sp. NPDC003318 TaxID=3364503 RepID=UPI0036A88982
MKIAAGSGSPEIPGAEGEREILRTLTRVVSAIDAAGMRFAVAGGCAVYARGGPPTGHDVDVFLAQEDVSPALRALEKAGLRACNPPEDWLVKAYDGTVLVDLVFRPNGRPVGDELLDRATWMRIGPTAALVISATDLMVDKLLVLDAHRCDFVPLLQIARDLREQVDWSTVATEVAGSAYARAFLVLVSELGIACTVEGSGTPTTAVRVEDSEYA